MVMGKILNKMSWPRDTWTVSSKVFFGASHSEKKPNQTGLSRKHVIEACHAAMKRLQVDYLDLYFCHRADAETPVEETVRAMTDLIRQGKVLYWGTSEWSAQQIMEAHAAAARHHLVPPSMEQPQYNMATRFRFENEYARLFSEFGMGSTIWSPLASGILTGKYNQGVPDSSRLAAKGNEWLRSHLDSERGKEVIDLARKMEVIAKELGLSLPRMALAWCLKNPNVSTVILGATREEQLAENFKASEDQKLLTPEVLKKINDILGPAKPGK